MTYLPVPHPARLPLVLMAISLSALGSATGWAASSPTPGSSAVPSNRSATVSSPTIPVAPPHPSVLPHPSPTAHPSASGPASPSPVPHESPIAAPSPSLGSPAVSPGPAGPFSWEHVVFDRLDGDIVRFRTTNGSPVPKAVKTRLGDLHYFGLIRNDAGMPYFIFGGRSHKSSGGMIGDLNERGIQIIRPDRGRVAGFTFPGKILDPRSRALLHESRAFFGRCVNSRGGDVYVVFQQDRNDRRRSLQSSVYIAEPGADYLIEKLIERQRAPRIKDALARLHSKSCVEIDGANRLANRKTLNLNPRDSDDELSSDGDDQETKENQTDQDLTPSQD